jgi:hypothetical protein
MTYIFRVFVPIFSKQASIDLELHFTLEKIDFNFFNGFIRKKGYCDKEITQKIENVEYLLSVCSDFLQTSINRSRIIFSLGNIALKVLQWFHKEKRIMW